MRKTLSSFIFESYAEQLQILFCLWSKSKMQKIKMASIFCGSMKQTFRSQTKHVRLKQNPQVSKMGAAAIFTRFISATKKVRLPTRSIQELHNEPA